MQNRVFVLDKHHHPLMPCHPARARELLSKGKAVVPKGKYKGSYTGVVAVRTSGYFDIKDVDGSKLAQGISHKHITLVQRTDGYAYTT
jgi:hypothetical protein